MTIWLLANLGLDIDKWHLFAADIDVDDPL